MPKVTILEVIPEERRVTINEKKNTIKEVERYLDRKKDIWEENSTRTDKYYEIQEIEIILLREEGVRKITFDFVDWEYWDTHENLGEMISNTLLECQRGGIRLIDDGEEECVLCVGDLYQLLGFEIGELG